MTVPPEITRKVRQLDHDVPAIYEMLAGLHATQHRHGNRLDEIAETQIAHGQTLEHHGAKLDAHGAKLDGHEAKLDEILQILRSGR